MERSNTHPYENTPFNDDPDSAEEEEVDVITCSTCHAERDNGVGEEEDQDDAEADGWKCDSFEWYCPECVAEEEEPNTCYKCAARCNCITKGGQPCCQNDFKCSICGVCLYWKGYEEGDTKCGCQWDK